MRIPRSGTPVSERRVEPRSGFRRVRRAALAAPVPLLLAAGLTGCGSAAGDEGQDGAAAPVCEPGDSPLAVDDGDAASPDALELPEPVGPHAVGTTQLVLTDAARPDPLDPAGDPRELLVQVWYPTDATADAEGCAPTRYAAPATAAANEEMFAYPEGSLDSVRSPALLDAPVAGTERGLPVVLYAHGLYGSLMDNTAVALQLASDGYAVVATGTTHESPAVEFPDGRVVGTSEEANALIHADDITPLIGLRADDASFVLDQLAAGGTGEGAGGFPADLAAAVDTDTVAMFGHSAGGAAALRTAQVRDEVAAAVNLDGFARQPDAEAGLQTPWLFVNSETHTPETEPSWPPFFDASGPGELVQIAGAGHLAVTDVGSDGWIDAMGLAELMPEEAFELNYGDLAPGTMSAIAQGVAAFFDTHLRDGEGSGRSFAETAERDPEIIESIIPVP